MVAGGVLALAGLGVALGLRHGIDWDHIAAIADITSSAVTVKDTEEARAAGEPYAARRGFATASRFARMRPADGPGAPGPGGGRAVGQWRQETRVGLELATLYALGHASVVVMLGLLAIWAGSLLPAWIDPLLERIVGVTLLALGLWIVYSLWRYGRSFRLQSRWMVVLTLIRWSWATAGSKLTGRRPVRPHDITRYGPKTAFGIGALHGIGAETGSQALLLAAAAGATTPASGSLLLLSFTLGLLLSNALVAAFSTAGFVSSSTKRAVYVVIGAIAAVFSLVVGAFFVAGQGAALPDLQEVIAYFFGLVRVGAR